MNPIADNVPPQQGSKTMQDVVPPPGQATPQPSAGAYDGPIQPEIVNDLPVKAQEALLTQTQKGADNPIADNRPSGPVAVGQDDKELDKALRDVNRRIKKDDNKPSRVSIFKRWE